MAVICPTVTAYDEHQYHDQIVRIGSYAERVHIDFMDGEFAPTLSPPIADAWWPHALVADFHVMYRRPMDWLEHIIAKKPNLVIVQAEAEVHHMHFAAELHKAGIEAGLCVLQDTPIANVEQIMHSFDHVLIFSGNLGHHGGDADMGLLDKVRSVRQHHPEVEIGWDGGINVDNISQLIDAGVSVLNIGGALQKTDNPAELYATLKAKAERHT